MSTPVFFAEALSPGVRLFVWLDRLGLIVPLSLALQAVFYAYYFVPLALLALDFLGSLFRARWRVVLSLFPFGLLMLLSIATFRAPALILGPIYLARIRPSLRRRK